MAMRPRTRPTRDGWRAVPCVVAAAIIAGCASRVDVMPPVPVAPRHVEFEYPSVPPNADPRLADRVERGWRYLQADNLRSAEREFDAALTVQPAFHPAETGLAYVELARRNAAAAVTRFDRAVARTPGYAPALVGRGQALLELERDGEALASFEAALAADPSLSTLQARIDVLRFRAVQGDLARAKAASDAGRFDEARAAYAQAITASPDAAFLYRELGAVERAAGQPERAIEQFRKAVALDPADARSLGQIGELLEERGDRDGAIAAYEAARAIDPTDALTDRIARLREADALARLPAEYRSIPASAGVTRGEVAAMLGVRLTTLVAAARQRQAVVTDVRGHWAQQWILTAVRAGVMDTQPNYTFQPSARVRRGDLAQTVSRVLTLIAAVHPARAKPWRDARLKIADVPPGHLSYPAVSQAVAAGVLPLDASGAFQLLRPVTGAELVDAIGRLEALAQP